jgi:hypothetical protein
MLTVFLYLNFLDCPVMGPCPGMGLSTLRPPERRFVHQLISLTVRAR